jgi:hypothetical protein
LNKILFLFVRLNRERDRKKLVIHVSDTENQDDETVAADFVGAVEVESAELTGVLQETFRGHA